MIQRAIIFIAFAIAFSCANRATERAASDSCVQRCNDSAAEAYVEENVSSDSSCQHLKDAPDPDAFWECLWGARADRAVAVRSHCEQECSSE